VRLTRPTGAPPPDVAPALVLSGRLLALDISSTAAGWATFRAGALDEFGVIRPPGRVPSVARIDAIAAGVAEVVGVGNCFTCVMEWTAGKLHRRLGRPSGLATLGQSQGVVRERLRTLGVPTWLVGEEWTGSRPKTERARRAWLAYPEFGRWALAGHDPGMDAADALGLGEWAIGRAREAELLARAGGKGGGR
jgi:hypothetical protein